MQNIHNRLVILDKKIGNYDTIFSLLFSKLTNQNFNFFDIGARNGSFILPKQYAEQTTIFGFEPNPDEFIKLKDNKTDALMIGIKEFNFKKRSIFDTAIYEKKCKKKIFITKGEGAVTLMGPANKKIVSNLSISNNDEKNFYDKVFQISEEKTVKCDKLDNIWKKNEYIDFLKLDTEGSELSILKGTSKLLKKKRILLIKSEFIHTPYYKDHSLLGHQQVFLNKFGYRLIYVENNHLGYSWKKTKINSEYDKRFQYAGDAYYIVDPDLHKFSKEEYLRLGLICLALGFNSSGINFIKDSNYFSRKITSRIEELATVPSISRFLANEWKKIPAKVLNYLYSLKKILNI
tara:strand:+ start:2347 stop:3387 length:1041 start_codon:yes stop_codon:yes gene_type:complete